MLNNVILIVLSVLLVLVQDLLLFLCFLLTVVPLSLLLLAAPRFDGVKALRMRLLTALLTLGYKLMVLHYVAIYHIFGEKNTVSMNKFENRRTLRSK